MHRDFGDDDDDEETPTTMNQENKEANARCGPRIGTVPIEWVKSNTPAEKR